MISPSLRPVAGAYSGSRAFSTSTAMRFKVAVIGGAGGIGQPLALILKQNPLVSHLAVHDVAPVTPGVAVDLSHVNTPTKVTGHKGLEEMPCAIYGAHVVAIPAGVPRKPGMSRDDLFSVNASIIRDTAKCVAQYSPCAVMAIITNPVNSIVPFASEIMMKYCAYDPARILGVTTLDLVRASTFIGEINCIDPRYISVPVIGGHSGITIIPLLSQSRPPINLADPKKIEALTKRIQEAGTEVVKAKGGGGSATLAMAFAGGRMVNAILRGLNGERNIIECAYVRSCLTEARYFANPVMFGPWGVERNLGFPPLNKYEEQLLKAAMPELLNNIKTGEEFAHKPY